jgi:hypothetical protein
MTRSEKRQLNNSSLICDRIILGTTAAIWLVRQIVQAALANEGLIKEEKIKVFRYFRSVLVFNEKIDESCPEKNEK